MAGALGHGLWAFVKHYLLKHGYRDGWAGFVIALGNFEGTFYRYAKRYEEMQGWLPAAAASRCTSRAGRLEPGFDMQPGIQRRRAGNQNEIASCWIAIYDPARRPRMLLLSACRMCRDALRAMRNGSPR